ncbi:MAG TPA: patatin-like phospholipase family protein [Blastocatellia bacterium]|nr:patatin-like phospholipase family protein [Blastocatellia bacterium]
MQVLQEKQTSNNIQSSRIGLALSGGSVRGLAHIGVIKALSELGIKPSFIAGTSAGSLIGAGLASGMDWRDLTAMAESVFWPSLLNGKRLERFCAKHFPENFDQLKIPFAAMVTALPSKQAVTITNGHLASALNASCALRIIRRPVLREGQRLKDGGIACVLPSAVCRKLGAEFVIASDVWEFSSMLRSVGINSEHSNSHRMYPEHYRTALSNTDVFIQPFIPVSGCVPSRTAVKRMIAVGEQAAYRAFESMKTA